MSLSNEVISFQFFFLVSNSINIQKIAPGFIQCVCISPIYDVILYIFNAFEFEIELSLKLDVNHIFIYLSWKSLCSIMKGFHKIFISDSFAPLSILNKYLNWVNLKGSYWKRIIDRWHMWCYLHFLGKIFTLVVSGYRS